MQVEMIAQRPSVLVTDQEILTLLEEGRATPSMLLNAANTTDSQQYIQNRLQHLREHGLVHRPGRGVYDLTERGERAADHLQLYRNDDREAFWERVDN